MTKPVQMLFLILLNIFFEENIKSNLALVNFLALLRDGSTDRSITEQEVVYVIFTDPETHLPVLKFFQYNCAICKPGCSRTQTSYN